MKLSSRILINGKVKRFGDIYNLFSKTGYGMILSQRIRWSIYKPQEMSHTAWEQLIGPDANNLKHLLVSYRLTQLFLLKQKEYSKKEQELLLFTAIVHDWGEPVVGDTMRYVKTARDDKKELEVLVKIMKDVFYGKLNRRLEKAVLSILSNKTTKLGEAFRVIEVIGYFKTVFLAWQKAKKKTGRITRQLRWLTSNVLHADMDFLVEKASKYRFISDFLDENRPLITEAFESMPDLVFSMHPLKKQAFYYRKFQSTKKSWRDYNKRFYGTRTKTITGAR